MTTSVSAFEARQRFGELLDLVMYGGQTFIVEKHGVPVVQISAVPKAEKKLSRKEVIAKYSGVWSEDFTKEVEKNIADLRKGFKLRSYDI